MSSSGTSVVSSEHWTYYKSYMSVYDHNGSDWSGVCFEFDHYHVQHIKGLKTSGDGTTIVVWKKKTTDTIVPTVLRRPSTNGEWTLKAEPTPTNVESDAVQDAFYEFAVIKSNTHLALAVSHNGSRIAVGYIDSNNPQKSGGVYVVDAVSEEGTELWRLAGNVLYAAAGETIATMANDEHTRFGASLSLSADGTRLAVGVPGNIGVNSNVPGFAPFARVYELVDASANWTRVGQDVTPEAQDRGHYVPTGTYFGHMVRLSDDGSRLLVMSGTNDAFARVYELNVTDTDTGADAAQTRRWRPLGQRLDFSSDEHYYTDGAALSGDGSTVAVGTSYANRNGLAESGSVHVYRLEGHGTDSERWERVGLDFDGDHEGARMGKGYHNDAGGVALSFDGTRLAAGGGRGNFGAEGGSRMRSVRVFDTTSATV